MENLNSMNLKEQFLKMYVKESSQEQLQYINSLLDKEDYKQIDEIVEEYANNIINNKDLKEFVKTGGTGTPIGSSPINPNKEEFSTEDMDPQAFELYCILMLIDEYEKEQDEEKKEMLKNQIQMAIERYRTLEELPPSKSR